MGGGSEKKEHDSDASSSSSDEDLAKPLIEERAGARRRRRQNSISISSKTSLAEKVSTLKDMQELDTEDIRVLQTVAEGEREEYEVRDTHATKFKSYMIFCWLVTQFGDWAWFQLLEIKS